MPADDQRDEVERRLTRFWVLAVLADENLAPADAVIALPVDEDLVRLVAASLPSRGELADSKSVRVLAGERLIARSLPPSRLIHYCSSYVRDKDLLASGRVFIRAPFRCALVAT